MQARRHTIRVMIDPKYLDAIKRFEGFTAKARWDYAQSSNGFGTRARYDGEVIDRAEAERRFKTEIASAYDIVQRFAPNLDDGTKAALTSLTFNAGPAWTKLGLGKAILAGDLDAAREIFQKYNRAGGTELAGLTTRRSAEAAWFSSAGELAQGVSVAKIPTANDAAASGTNLPNRVLAALAATSPDAPTYLRTPSLADPSVANSAFPTSDGTPLRSPITLDSVLVLLSLLAGDDRSNDDQDRSGNSHRLPGTLAPPLVPTRA